MAQANFSNLKPHRIRESTRAKHVSIKITHAGEIEVVIPIGFDRQQLPDILAKRQDWIAKTMQRIAAERQSLPGLAGTQPEYRLPDRLRLRAIPEDWQVCYQPTEENRIRAVVTRSHELTLMGATHATDECATVLKRWLRHKAEIELLPWLRQVSRSIHLPYSRASIRGQKTLWGSCSSRHTLSLNYKLLFLPPHLVRYVFIHELCHTVHLNHSPAYWALVAENAPDYQRLDAELNKACPYVPEWLERVTN